MGEFANFFVALRQAQGPCEVRDRVVLMVLVQNTQRVDCVTVFVDGEVQVRTSA